MSASIEQRLREMQRKLSEIAEIPKILSSTLATVSQTFDKLMPCDARELKQLALRGATHRKFSYDEDLLDYELSDNPNDDDDGEEDEVDDGEEEDSEISEQDEDGVKRSEDRELTPESDYASEVDYLGNEEDDGDDYDDEEDDDDDDYNSELHEDDIKYEGDVNLEKLHDDFDEEDDFLNTTYTWNLRNVPKLVLTDEVNAELNLEEKTVQEKKVAKVVQVEVEEKKQLKESQDSSSALKNVKQEKLDKVERSWPWADREKIIYKQSTCHLVPRKPLGIIEQKVQLLDKQHLVTNLKQIQEQQQWDKK